MVGNIQHLYVQSHTHPHTYPHTPHTTHTHTHTHTHTTPTHPTPHPHTPHTPTHTHLRELWDDIRWRADTKRLPGPARDGSAGRGGRGGGGVGGVHRPRLQQAAAARSGEACPQGVQASKDQVFVVCCMYTSCHLLWRASCLHMHSLVPRPAPPVCENTVSNQKLLATRTI